MRIPPVIKKTLLFGVLLFFGLYALILALLWGFQEQIFFKGRSLEAGPTPQSQGWAFEELWLDVAGAKTHGWWIPREAARGVVLFSHGSGKNISHYLDDAAIFRDLGFSVLVYDYGGYGQSTGKPSEARCCADIRAIWHYLLDVQHISPARIVLAGASLGGGVTADLAAEVTPGAVILESTFKSIPNALADTHPWIPACISTRIQFRSIDKVQRIGCPVLVIHSLEDTVVPIAHGRALYDRVLFPKAFVEIHGAHRGGKFSSREGGGGGGVYTAGLKGFLDTYMKPL